jgi:hypothetical protein
LAQATSAPIHWRLAAGVVALQAALQLGWIIYRAYQPELLRSHGYAAWLLPFALLPGLLGLLIEPLSGALSDRWNRRARGRLLPITVSVTVAGLIFLSVAGLLQRDLGAGLVLLPVAMVVWMVAVQSTSSPNLAQLNEAVSLRQLPRAAALLTLSQGLIGAGSEALGHGALALGPALTFLLGALVLGLGLVVLRWANPASSAREPAKAVPIPAAPVGLPLSAAALLLAISLAVGAVAQVLLGLLPRQLALEPPGAVPLGAVPLILLGSALAAPWTGSLVGRWGRRRSLPLSLALLTPLLALALLLPGRFVVPLLPVLGVVHGALLTSLTATSLATLPSTWSGLGAGLALGGSGLAGSLFLLEFAAPASPSVASVLGALVLAAAVALLGCRLLNRLAVSASGADRPN